MVLLKLRRCVDKFTQRLFDLNDDYYYFQVFDIVIIWIDCYNLDNVKIMHKKEKEHMIIRILYYSNNMLVQ